MPSSTGLLFPDLAEPAPQALLDGSARMALQVTPRFDRIGVNRLLTKSGEISDSWRRRLDTLLGTTDWYDELYTVESNRTLFGTDEQRVTKAATETIGRYFNERLKTPSSRSLAVSRQTSEKPA